MDLSHRGIRKVLGELVAGDQGYVNLKKKLHAAP
jgi:hypothetical protein